MYFDLSPRSRGQRPRSPRTASPKPSAATATTTTTLLPFRRSGRAVNVASALSPVREYTQPQWALRSNLETAWAPPGSAAAASHLLSSPPPPMHDAFLQQQQQQQQQYYEQRRSPLRGSATPHAYDVGERFDTPGGSRPYARSPYGERHTSPYANGAAGGRAEAVQPPPPPPPPPLMSSLASTGALPRQPFASPPLTDDAAFTTPPPRRDSVLPSDRRRSLGQAPGGGNTRTAPSLSASRPRGRGITEVRPGCTTSTERVRYRNNVTKKLIDLYDEVAELYACRENMNFQVTQAMRSDPRFTKERHGEVRLAYKPTPPQQAAMTAVDTALEALHDACHELVASYLTPEEKRYLGIDTHLFQTRAEKKSTYQYAPASARGKAKAATPPQQQQRMAAAAAEASVPSSRASSSSSIHNQRHHDNDNDDASPRRQTAAHEPKFTSQSTSLPSASTPAAVPRASHPSLSPSPIQHDEDERTATTIRAALSPSPPSVVPASAPAHTSMEQPYTFVQEDSGAPAPTTPAARQYSTPSLSPQQQQSVQSPAAAAGAAPPRSFYDAEPEDTVAVASVTSPERMYAPAASSSSLGGGGWPSDTASATVRAASVRVPQSPMLAKTSLAAGSSTTMRGPQGQLLVKMPVKAPTTPTAWPPGIPPGAKLVKMPMGVPPPSVAASGGAGSGGAGGAPSASSHPPSHPPSRTNSFTNRTTAAAAAAPKAPVTRAEFRRFMIDSDSDSTMA